jgi:iron complex outermembrane recepter protein
MSSRRTTYQVASILLLSAGIAAAQTQETPSTETPAPPGAVGLEPPPASAFAPEGGRRAAEEQIVITGSRTRRKDLTTPAPVTVITREEFRQSGKLTIGEFLQTLPEQGNAPNFQLNNGGATYSADGSTRINLRSLGVTRTLVLINGRRVVPAGVGASAAVDLNSIPATAVERIEILKDGGSAVYGSDAIAGVVNIITRRTFNGTEASAQYGVSQHGDAQTFNVDATTGQSGDFGNFIFSVGYFNQKESWLRARSWSAQALTYDYNLKTTSPGGSFRTPQGTIGLPTNGTNPTAACTANPLCNYWVTNDANWTQDAFIRVPSVLDRTQFNAWKIMTDADTYNFAAVNYLTIPSIRTQVYSGGDTNLGLVRGYYETSYVQRDSQQNAAPMPLNPGDYTLPGGNTPITMSANSLYNPWGVDLPFAGRRLVEFGNRTYSQELATFRVVTGLDGTLPEATGPVQGWYWNASMNYGRTSGTFTTQGAIRNSKIADALGPSMLRVPGDPSSAVCVKTPGDLSTVIPGCVPMDLFGGPNNGSINASQINGLGFTGTSRAFDALFAVNADATGDLFKLASDRPVSLAVGYEWRRQSGSQIADPIAASGDSADFNFQSTTGHYVSNEGYAELTAPLLSNAPGVSLLEANAAGRLVDYSTFGTKFTWKLGARYSPIPDFTVRGTYSTAFRAPSIGELFLGQTETAPTVSDPCNFGVGADPRLVQQCIATGVGAGGSGDTGNQELAHQGGNSLLQPETAKVFTVGIVLQPQLVRNLSVTFDYYNTFVEHAIGTIGVAGIIAGCYPAASGSLADPNQQYCSLIHRANGRILFVVDTNQNIGTARTAGIDMAIRYALPAPVGRFGFAFDGTWLGFYDVNGPNGKIEAKGTYDLGFPLPEYKYNLGANWSLAGFTVGGIVRYVGSFKECGAFNSSSGHFKSTGGLCYADVNAPHRQVGSHTTLDLNASYTLSSPVGKTLFLIGMTNVFDKAPQYVYSAALANSDPTIYDFVGRFVYGRIQQTF